jgi:hypothetical protein
MRVTTTIFTVEFPIHLFKATETASLQELSARPDTETAIELRSFLSLYSGRNRMDRLDSSLDEGA